MIQPQSQAEWDARYQEKDRLWSGNPNAMLLEYASDIPPGVALDVGCGEGADALWLAQNGWKVTGIDLSTVAIGRAKEHAAVQNLNAEFLVRDARSYAEEVAERFDLVTAFFLHSRDEDHRAATMRALTRFVKPGGRILVASHAEMPPWSKHHEHADGSPRPTFKITAKSEIADLGIADWLIDVAEEKERTATGPEGEEAPLRDAVVLARKPAENGTC